MRIQPVTVYQNNSMKINKNEIIAFSAKPPKVAENIAIELYESNLRKLINMFKAIAKSDSMAELYAKRALSAKGEILPGMLTAAKRHASGEMFEKYSPEKSFAKDYDLISLYCVDEKTNTVNEDGIKYFDTFMSEYGVNYRTAGRCVKKLINKPDYKTNYESFMEIFKAYLPWEYCDRCTDLTENKAQMFAKIRKEIWLPHSDNFDFRQDLTNVMFSDPDATLITLMILQDDYKKFAQPENLHMLKNMTTKVSRLRDKIDLTKEFNLPTFEDREMYLNAKYEVGRFSDVLMNAKTEGSVSLALKELAYWGNIENSYKSKMQPKDYDKVMQRIDELYNKYIL